MSGTVIIIDGGTTNTRLALVRDGKTLCRTKLACGAGDTARLGSNRMLAESVKNAIGALTAEAGMELTALDGIYASGMIGSELGLHAVPHIPTPAGLKELARGCETVSLPAVSPVPITFVPGVKSDSRLPDECDLMRGEEVEALGIRALCGEKDAFVLLLPGTHNKIIFLDADGCIERFCTAMSGELTRCICEHTILREALDGGYTKTPDRAFLLKGYDLCEMYGFTAALFKIRVFSKQMTLTAAQLYSMLVGMVLHEDVKLALSFGSTAHVRVAGSEPFKSALGILFAERTAVDAAVTADELVEESTLCRTSALIETLRS